MIHHARNWLAWLLWVAGVLLVVATLIPIINSDFWFVRNFTFPQVQITVAIGIVLILALVLDLGRTGVRLLAAGLVASLIYQLYYLLPYSPLASRTVVSVNRCPPGHAFSLLELNVRASNPDHQAVLSLVRDIDPDLFFAVETDNRWQHALATLRQRYPYVVVAPRNDYWAMMLFSKRPLENARVRTLVDDYVPSIEAQVVLPSGTRFVFHGLHPKPPMMHGSAKGDADVIRAARDIARDSRPAILTGDLNDVPWSSTTQQFQKLSGMKDPRVGRGLYPSFDANSRLLRWPLDHVFVTPGFDLVQFQRLRDVGSDHFPMKAILCLSAR